LTSETQSTPLKAKILLSYWLIFFVDFQKSTHLRSLLKTDWTVRYPLSTAGRCI